MHPSPPHVHAHITSTPYSLHTLGQLFLQTSVLPEVDLVGEAFPGYFALVTLSDLQSFRYILTPYTSILFVHLLLLHCMSQYSLFYFFCLLSPMNKLVKLFDLKTQ